MVGVTPQQRGGSNATTIGMVVAIIVAVVLLGVLIWLFTQQEQLRTTADQATRATNRLARGSDESTAKQMFPDASAPGKTLVGEMNKGLQLICGRTTGNQNDSPQNAVRELDAALDEIRKNMADPEPVSASYGTVTIIKNLHGMFQDERTAREEAEATLAKARNDLDALIAANKELEDNYKGELDKMSAKVDELQRNKNEIEDLKGTELAALKRQISDKQDALDSLRQDRMEMQATFRKEVGKLHQAIDEQGRALADLRGAGTHQAADPMAVAREPIGEVLRALPGDSLVHIDLGKRDKVTLGMTFSVYPGEARVPATGRGKGNIEVVSLGDRTAECRITTPPSPEDPILPGDRVGNIVLSRNRAKKTRICVVGQFDVDFDGQIDARGAEKIKALAERYGAEVVDTVDAMTDYLVVGLEPPGLPEEYKRGEVGEEEAAETRDTAEQEDEYDEGEDEGEDEVEDDEGEDEGEDEV
ncbi:MAG: hypothetical protein JXQ75_18810, partial [Phycisphaerae bacterium]|nr:hypothetical protein [Phycisphaerae bacterium]